MTGRWCSQNSAEKPNFVSELWCRLYLTENAEYMPSTPTMRQKDVQDHSLTRYANALRTAIQRFSEVCKTLALSVLSLGGVKAAACEMCEMHSSSVQNLGRV
jgi:hypothetical protein